jgi:hypothetical protein
MSEFEIDAKWLSIARNKVTASAVWKALSPAPSDEFLLYLILCFSSDSPCRQEEPELTSTLALQNSGHTRHLDYGNEYDNECFIAYFKATKTHAYAHLKAIEFNFYEALKNATKPIRSKTELEQEQVMSARIKNLGLLEDMYNKVTVKQQDVFLGNDAAELAFENAMCRQYNTPVRGHVESRVVEIKEKKAVRGEKQSAKFKRSPDLSKIDLLVRPVEDESKPPVQDAD